jgi:nucleotide-binding universal stress UspA family protein
MLEPGLKVSIEKVLFATDFSTAAENAFSHAVAIANGYQAKLIVVHVISIESFELLDDDSARLLIERARAGAISRINRLLEPQKLTRDQYEIAVPQGVISEVLVDTIRSHHVDVAVLSTHGRRAFKKLLMGSVAEEVFRAAPCPVLTVGPHVKPATVGVPKHVLYPIHFAPDMSPAAAYAVSLAERYGAALTVMNVRDDMPASENVRVQVTPPVEHWIDSHLPIGSELRNRIRFEAGFGPAADAILSFAEKETVDMIVMQVRRLDPTISAHLLKADTAYELATSSTCPVLTVGE